MQRVKDTNIKLYSEASLGSDVAALLQTGELLGFEVRLSMPRMGNDDAYVLIDLGSRGSVYDDEGTARELWYKARAEFSRAFRLVGLVHRAPEDPPPGAEPVKILSCMPILCRLRERIPLAISRQSLGEQLIEVEKADTRAVLHFLENSFSFPRPVLSEVLVSLERTLKKMRSTIWLTDLRKIREEIIQSDPNRIRNILIRFKNLVEKNYEDAP